MRILHRKQRPGPSTDKHSKPALTSLYLFSGNPEMPLLRKLMNPVCQPKHEPTDFEITYKSGCLGERNAKANDYC